MRKAFWDLDGDGDMDTVERDYMEETLCTSREEHIALFGDEGDWFDEDEDDDIFDHTEEADVEYDDLYDECENVNEDKDLRRFEEIEDRLWDESGKELEVPDVNLDEHFLKDAEYYENILDLNEYLQLNMYDEKARYEYITLLFNTLVQPKHVFAEGEAEYIANLCIENINKIVEKRDIESRYRMLRLKFAKGSCLMVVGKLKDAYDLFTSLAVQIEMFARERRKDSIWADILFRCEVNIHQIKELCGIDDGKFFSQYREEILFFEAFADQIVFSYKGAYCLPVLIPLIDEYRNAFYQVYDNSGENIVAFGFGGQFFCLNQARLGYSGKYTLKYWPINLYSGVSNEKYAEWTWQTKEILIDRNQLQKHIKNHPYEKIEGYLSMLVASNNRRNGRG